MSELFRATRWPFRSRVLALFVRRPSSGLGWRFPAWNSLAWATRASFVVLTTSVREEGYQSARSGGPRGRGPGRQEYDEAALLAAAQRGDLPAFNQLILHYQSLAYNIAYRLTNDADLAADATQDAFIKAYQRLSQYRGGSFKSWVLRIVTNTCYDALRARKRRPTTPLESEEDEDDPEYDARLIDAGERPEDRAMRQELAVAIQRAISQLPPDQRTALVLSDVEGMDYQEIADATGAALGTVKSRLSRARAKVRDLLMEHQELLPASYRLTDS